MSSIDERVVELQFDNAQFESGVKQSIGTLEKLKSSLNLDKSARGLDNLQRAGKNFSLTNVAENVQTVANRFSTLGIIGDQVLRRLTNSAMNMGRNLLTAIPNQMISGGKRRAQNIEQAKFQMEGLLGAEEFAKQWDTINANINAAVAGTAYGYDAAAKVAAQLNASSIDFGEDMEKALRGVSGVAAMTNSSYEDIGHIFTTIAGQGKVMTEQLNQFAGRGLNVAATLAKSMGKTEAELRELVTKGKVDFKTFAFAMNDAFGEQATKANKTFSGALSNIKASFSRMGAQFAAPAYEAVRKFLVGPDIDKTGGLLAVLKDIEGILKPISDQFSVYAESATTALNGILDSVHATLKPLADAGNAAHEAFENAKEAAKATTEQTAATEKAAKANKEAEKSSKALSAAEKKRIQQTNKLDKPLTVLKDNVDELGNGYKELSGIEKWATDNEELLHKVWNKVGASATSLTESLVERVPILGQLINLNKKEGESAASTAKEYERLDELAKDVILGKYGNGEERKKALDELGLSYAIIQNRVNELLGVEKRHAVSEEDEAKMAKYFGTTVDEEGKKVEKTKSIFDNLANTLAGLAAAFQIVTGFASALFTKIIAPFISWGFEKVLSGILFLTGAIGEKLVALRDKVQGGDLFNKSFEGLANFFRNIGSAIGSLFTKVKWLDAFNKLVETFSTLGNAIGTLFSNGFDKIVDVFSGAGEASKDINFDWLLPIIEGIIGGLTKLGEFATSVVTAVGSRLEQLGGAFVDLWNKLQNSEPIRKLIESFGSLTSTIRSIFGAGLDKITGLFTNVTRSAEDAEKKLSFDWLLNIIETLSSGLSWLADKLNSVFSNISVDGVWEWLSDLGTSLQGIIDKAANLDGVTKFVTAMENLGTAIGNLFDKGLDRVAGNIQRTGEKAEEAEKKFNFDWLLPIIDGIAAGLGLIADAIASIINNVGPTLTKLSTGLQNLWLELQQSEAVQKLSESFTQLKESASGFLNLGLEKITNFFSSLTGTAEKGDKAVPKKLLAGMSGAAEAGEAVQKGFNLGWLLPIIERFSNALSSLAESLSKIMDLAVANGGNLGEAISEWFTSIDLKEQGKQLGLSLISGFGEIFGADSDVENSTRSIPEKMATGIQEGLGPALEKEKKGISEKIKAFFKSAGFKKIFKGIKIAGISALGIKLGKTLFNFGKSIKGVPALLGDMSNVLTSYQRNLQADTIMKIGIAIGILALALIGLSLIPSDKLHDVSGVLLSFVLAIGGFITAITAIKAAKGATTETTSLLGGFIDGISEAAGKALKIAGIGIAFAGVAAAVYLIVKVITSLMGIPTSEVLKQLGIIALIMVGLGVAIVAMNKIAKDFNASSVVGIFLLAAAIAILVPVIKLLGTMDWKVLLQGGAAIVVLALGLATAARVAGKNEMAKFGAGCLILAAALHVLLAAIVGFSLMSWNTFLHGFGKIAVIIGTLAGVIYFITPALTLFGSSIKDVGKAMLMVAGSVVLFGVGLASVGLGFQIFVNAIISSANTITANLGSFIGGLLAVVGVLGIFIALGYAANGAAPGLFALAAVIVAISVAALALTGSFAILGTTVKTLLPGIGGIIEGAFSGVIDTLKMAGSLVTSFLEKIPGVGDLINSFKNAGTATFEVKIDKVLDDFDLNDQEKADIIDRMTTLLKFTKFEDFPVELGKLIAYVDSLDLPPGKKSQLKARLFNELIESMRTGTTLLFDSLAADIGALTFAPERRRKLIELLKKLASGNLTPEEKRLVFDEYVAEIKSLNGDNLITDEQAADLQKRGEELLNSFTNLDTITVHSMAVKVDILSADGAITEEQAADVHGKIEEYLNGNATIKDVHIAMVDAIVDNVSATNNLDENKTETLRQSMYAMVGANSLGEYNLALKNVEVVCDDIGLSDKTTANIITVATAAGEQFNKTFLETVKNPFSADVRVRVTSATVEKLSASNVISSEQEEQIKGKIEDYLNGSGTLQDVKIGMIDVVVGNIGAAETLSSSAQDAFKEDLYAIMGATSEGELELALQNLELHAEKYGLSPEGYDNILTLASGTTDLYLEAIRKNLKNPGSAADTQFELFNFNAVFSGVGVTVRGGTALEDMLSSALIKNLSVQDFYNTVIDALAAGGIDPALLVQSIIPPEGVDPNVFREYLMEHLFDENMNLNEQFFTELFSDTAYFGGIQSALVTELENVLGNIEGFDPQKLIAAFESIGLSAEEIQKALFPDTLEKGISVEDLTPDQLDKNALLAAYTALGGDGAAGYGTGFEEKQGETSETVTAFIEAMLAAAATAQDSHSPSLMFAELGKYAAEGYAQGITDNSSLVQKAVIGMIGQALGLTAEQTTSVEDILGLTDDGAKVTEAINAYNKISQAFFKGAGKTNKKNAAEVTDTISGLFEGFSAKDVPVYINDISDALNNLKEAISGFRELGFDVSDPLDKIVGFGYAIKPVGTTLAAVATSFSLLLSAIGSTATILADAELLGNITDNIPQIEELIRASLASIDKMTPEIASTLISVLSQIAETFRENGDILAQVAADMIITAVRGMALALSNNADEILGAIGSLLDGIGVLLFTAFAEITRSLPGIGGPLSEWFTSAAEYYKARMTGEIEEVKEIAKEGFNSVKEVMEASANGKGFNIASVVEKAFIFSNGDLTKAVESLKTKLKYGEISPNEIVSSLIPPEGVSTDELMSRLFPDGTFDEEAFKSLLRDSGAFTVEGLKEGIESNQNLVEGAGKTTGENLTKSTMNALGESSPSKVFNQIGVFAVIGLANGILKSVGIAKGAGTKLATEAINAVKNKIVGIIAVGTSFGTNFISGIKATFDRVQLTGKLLAGNAIKGSEEVNNLKDGGPYKVGQNYADGFIRGLKSRLPDAFKAGKKLLQEAEKGSKVAGQIKSPSKVAMRLGNFYGQGFVIGINQFGKKVYTAAHDMGETATEALRNPLSIVSDVLSGDLDVDPTIRPVMDLSEIQNGVRTINAMSPAMAVGIGSISASMDSRPRVDSNEEVISAIKSLKEGLSQPNVYNVNGVTYDDGSNISDAVRGLIRAARVERRR